MKKIILTTMCLALLSSCAHKQVIPEGCEGSLIYPIKQEWVIGAGVLKIGVLEAIKRNPELRQPTLDALGSIKELLNYEYTTYVEFAAVVIMHVEELWEMWKKWIPS